MSKKIIIEDTKISGLKILNQTTIGDSRGYFERLFCIEEMKDLLLEKSVKQINHTLTEKRGTIRGMHFQYQPCSEIKIVKCIRGEVYDVAIDLRENSDTFMCWHGEILSDKNHRSLFIPEGFAHGFQAVDDNCEMLYFHTASYNPTLESGINPFDSQISIIWPIENSILSEKDKTQKMLNNTFKGIKL